MMAYHHRPKRQIKFYEKDFYKEISEQKRIARGAIHRKGGSKSKKCSMSTDYMTQKQWKERNGPVMSYAMNEPIVWESFKKMPKDLQEQYVKNLVEKYGATYTNLSELFEVSVTTIRKYFEKQEIIPGCQVGHRMNAAQRVVWEEFLGIEEEEESVEISEETEVSEETVEDTSESEEEESETEPVKLEPAKSACEMNRFSVEFKGQIDVDMIANSLRMILGNTSNGTLRVEYYALCKSLEEDIF